MTVDKSSSEGGTVQDAAPAVDPLAAILSAITDVSGQVASLGKRVSDMETRTPRTTPNVPDRSWSHPSNAQEAMTALFEQGQGESLGSRTVPIMVNGQAIRADVFSLMKPRYQPGSVVRLRRDILQDDESGRTIGELLDERGLEGIGEVKRVYWLGRRLVWKYRVRFPGLTNTTGNGYYEDQLDPA